MGMRSSYKRGRRLDAKNIGDVLAALRLLDHIEDPSFAISKRQIEISKLERSIFLAATPGAYAEEQEVKHGGWQKTVVEVVYDGNGHPMIFFPHYLSSLDAAWKLISKTAPGIGITCEFLGDGSLKILAVHGPAGKDIMVEWPIRRAPHSLMIALFEYLAMAVMMPTKRAFPIPKRRASDVGGAL
jgi:hypothetical protein